MISSLLSLFAESSINVVSLPHTGAGSGEVKLILSIVFAVIGALALLFITLGGFRYIISQGDPQGTAKAKNTIIYAVAGLLVALGAEAIVTFVIGKL